jgi:hypothetical protein
MAGEAIKHLMVAIIALLIPITAMAEGECQQDRQKFCKDETKANVGACLEHMDELSEACKAMREARVLGSPKSDETSPDPASAQGSGNPASTEAKPSPAVEQPNADHAPSQAGSQILIKINPSRTVACAFHRRTLPFSMIWS